MANACRHRGVRVVDGAGETRRFTCPFHAWTYDLEGTLVGAARRRRVRRHVPRGEGPRRAAGHRGLRPRRRAGCAPARRSTSTTTSAPGLADELALLDFATWKPYGEPHVHPVGANWKVTLDTFRENYHFTVPAPDDARRVRLRRRAHVRRRSGRTCATARRCARSTSCADRPEEEWGDVIGALQLPVRAVPEHQPDLRQPPHRAVADPAGRRSTPRRSCTPRTMRPGPVRRRARQARGDGAVDLRDGGRRRGLLGRRRAPSPASAPACSTPSCSAATSRPRSTCTAAFLDAIAAAAAAPWRWRGA